MAAARADRFSRTAVASMPGGRSTSARQPGPSRMTSAANSTPLRPFLPSMPIAARASNTSVESRRRSTLVATYRVMRGVSPFLPYRPTRAVAVMAAVRVQPGTRNELTRLVMPVVVATANDAIRRGRTRRECSRDRASQASMSAEAAALASTGRASVSATQRPQRTMSRPAPRGERRRRRAR